MSITYDSHVRPYANSFYKHKLTQEQLDKAHTWASKMVSAKSGESHWKVDGRSGGKRQVTGKLGEMAVESLIGRSYVDWEIGSDSNKFNVADLESIGYRIGVKTVRYGDFPIIPKNIFQPQIIVIYREENQTCYICGLADVFTLVSNQTDLVVKDRNIIRRGTKTGFYGFKDLIPLNKENVIEILNKNTK